MNTNNKTPIFNIDSIAQVWLRLAIEELNKTDIVIDYTLSDMMPYADVITANGSTYRVRAVFGDGTKSHYMTISTN